MTNINDKDEPKMFINVYNLFLSKNLKKVLKLNKSFIVVFAYILFITSATTWPSNKLTIRPAYPASC